MQLWFVQLLQANDLSEKQRFQRINEYLCRVLMTLINDILDLSKMRRWAVLVQEAVDLVCYWRQWYFPSASDEKSLTLKFVIHLDMPRMVVCDPIRIRQVINNLVSNAIKFTTIGGVQVLDDSRGGAVQSMSG